LNSFEIILVRLLKHLNFMLVSIFHLLTFFSDAPDLHLFLIYPQAHFLLHLEPDLGLLLIYTV